MKNLESMLPPVEENLEHRIIEQIHHLELYQNYERAFVEATGLPLRLVSAGAGRRPGVTRITRIRSANCSRAETSRAKPVRASARI